MHRFLVFTAAVTLLGTGALAWHSTGVAAPTARGASSADTRPEFVIASIGDSYAAGEGTPVRNGDFDVNGKLEPGGSVEAWGGFDALGADFQGNTRADLCHRSRHAGAAVAAKLLQDQYPGVRIVFRSFACSGATIPKGLVGPYGGADDALNATFPDELPQIQQLDSFIDRRSSDTLDALVVGIGGNDLGFPYIVALCLIPKERVAALGAGLGAAVGALLGGPLLAYGLSQIGAITGGIAGSATAGCEGWDLAATVIGASLPGVERAYADLARAIGGTRAGPANVRLRFRPKRVYITEYPDPTHDENGVLCDGSGFQTGELYANLTRKEAQWISLSALPPINSAVHNAADAHDWTFVGGIADAFRPHGVCADNGAWFNDNNSALRHQGADLFPDLTLLVSALFGRPLGGGIAHPSIRGQQEIGEQIYARLRQQLRSQFAVDAAPRLSVTRYRSTPPSPEDAFKFRLTWTTPGIDVPVLRWQLSDGTRDARGRPRLLGILPNLRSSTYTGRGNFTFRLRACGHIGCGPWSTPVEASNLVGSNSE